MHQSTHTTKALKKNPNTARAFVLSNEELGLLSEAVGYYIDSFPRLLLRHEKWEELHGTIRGYHRED